jgi:DNA-3-methyladenine glycosylase I
MKKEPVKKRCDWAMNSPSAAAIYTEYHEKEWGVPLHDDQKLFELLIIEGAQAGLSWLTVLRKRENYRKAFDQFDASKISKYDGKKVRELLSNNGIIRNQLKIAATVQNSKSFLAIQKEFGTFDTYIWRFVGDKPKRNRWRSVREIPPTTAESDAMSKDLLGRGFKFVGSTICYAFMQSAGLVNDHLVGCFRYNEV